MSKEEIMEMVDQAIHNQRMKVYIVSFQKRTLILLFLLLIMPSFSTLQVDRTGDVVKSFDKKSKFWINCKVTKVKCLLIPNGYVFRCTQQCS